MKNGTTRYVGLDVHKATITVAICEAAGTPTLYGTIANDPGAIRKLVRLLGRTTKLAAAYEAGPTGYPLHRQLTELGVDCMVVAPSLLEKFLLRQAVRAPAGLKSWTKRHQSWLNQVHFPLSAAQAVFDDYRTTERAAEDLLPRLDVELRRYAADSHQVALIAALQALRGVGFLTAVTLVAETGDLRRFASARALMSFTGLTSSEHSSGASRHQGAITRTGNAYLRHVLVQAAHNARHAPRRGWSLRQRQAGLPPDLLELAWRAQIRLHHRHRHLLGRLGRAKTVTAVARELAGFVWAVGQRMMPEVSAA